MACPLLPNRATDHHPRVSHPQPLGSRVQLQVCDLEGSRMHSSQEVLDILGSKGIRIHRETLARVSDHLGLPTRAPGARGTARAWSREQVEQLVAHFHAKGWKQMVPVPRRPVTTLDGPFRTRDVLAFLELQGFALHRETLARISDELGLETRHEKAPTVQRQWTRQQIDEIIASLETRLQTRCQRRNLKSERLKRRIASTRQLLAGVDTEVLRALCEADPALADRLRSVLLAQTETSPTPAPGHPDPAPADEEAA